MKRKISSTLAVTLIASNMQSLSFAEGNENLKELPKKEVNIVNENIVKSEDKNSDETKVEEIASKDEKSEDLENKDVTVDENADSKEKALEKESTKPEVYEAKGKLELDLNFSLPIKYTTVNQTNITVNLKKGDESVGSIKLGNDNLNGNIGSDISYKLEAKDSKRNNLEANAKELAFYHLTFENLPLGQYSLEIVGDGYETALIENIDVTKSSKRVLAGTSENKVIVDGKEEVYPAVFLAGNVDSDNIVSMSDYNALKEQIKNNTKERKIDLNRDGKTDITDLTYIHQNMNKTQSQAVIVDTDVIINPENASIDIDSNKVEVQGDIKNILKSENSSVVLQTKIADDGTEVEISETNPVSIPISLDNTTRSVNKTEQIVIKAPSANAPSAGNIKIPNAGENGEDLIVDFNKASKSTRNGVDEIVIDLGKQVAVSQVTINITGSRSSKNLVEISKVEFVNNVYKEIPKPKMNIPVINNFTSGTAVGNEHFVIGWDHEPNVTGYEIKIEELNDNGTVSRIDTYRTSENTLRVEGVNGYQIYRMSIQSLSGDDWKSGYKDEQEGYDKTASGDTNLLNNSNDKDGIPDNVDADYNTQGWNSASGVLVKDNKIYGADSIVELQVIPETRPEGPEGITIKGVYKGLAVSWKSHKKAKDYDLYYRKVGTGAWTKANDPNEPKYEDSNPTNDIPDNVTELTPEQKTDKDELIRGTSYNINNLEEGATYEIKMTATNHHGTGGLSKTYLGTTTKLINPIVPNYKLINTPNDKTNHIVSAKVKHYRKEEYPEGTTPEEIGMMTVDNDYSTYWMNDSWDGGYNWGALGITPHITLDKEYTIDTIRFTTRRDSGYENQGFSDIKIGIPVKDGETGGTIKNGYRYIYPSVKAELDKNKNKYYTLVLNEPVTTSEIIIAPSTWPGDSPTISEIKLYHYDSLKSDVANLFKDDLMLELSEGVTQEKIDELINRAKTIDPESMEYHPDQDQLLKDLQRAQDLLNDINLSDNIKILDSGIRNQGQTIGQSNNYQALGVAVKPGDKVNIYIGSSRKDTKFNLAITQHNGESSTGYQVYNQKLSVGKNEIVIPESKFNMDYEKGGNLYLSFDSNYDEVQNVQVRVSGGTEIPHLNVNNLIDDAANEQKVKELIREYIKNLKSYVATLPSRYPSQVSAEDKINNIYRYDAETSILNTTDIEGERITLSLPADQVLKGIQGGLSSEEEQVQRVYDTLLAWEQIMKISYAQQGLLENPVDFDGDGKITNNKLEKLGGKSENEYFNANRAPRNRINIKYQRMFTGAFMYASSHHVGIGYGSSAGMMTGVPFKLDENGKLINSEDGQLFGWGIGHEIGHVHDRPGLTYAEVTNNILALMTQTYNDENSSRIEDGNGYEDVYDRVTSQSVGVPKGRTGLAMFWQLHLAYDDTYTYNMIKTNSDGDLDNDTFYSKLYRITREKGIAPSETGYDQTAQTYIMRASDAVKKDLRPFFKAWGLVASPKTDEYLNKMDYPVETRDIQYINDEARRKKLDAISKNDMSSITMADDVAVSASFGTDDKGNQVTEKTYLNQKSVPLNISVNKDNDKILGYEIIRKEAAATGFKEVPVGFVERNKESNITEYKDVIDSVNNRTFTYKVKAYDYSLNKSSEFELGTVKVTHDGSLAKKDWTFDTNTISPDDTVHENTGHGHNEDGSINNIKDNDASTVYNGAIGTDNTGQTLSGDPYVTINMGTSKQVVGLKYTPGNTTAKKFSFKRLFTKNKEVTYDSISDYEVLVSSDNKKWTKVHSGKFDTTKENTIYFNESGNDSNKQLWSTNAQYVKLVAKGAKTISIGELELLGQPGDNIEIGSYNNGKYTNGIGRLKSDYTYAKDKTIPAGSILITGEYRGDPAFNVPLVLNENDGNYALQSQVILLAELPDDAQLGEVAQGSWIYWITPDQQEAIINGEQNIKGSQVKAELYRYNKLDSTGAPVGQRLVSDTFLYELPSDLSKLPTIDLATSKARSSAAKVMEIDQNTVKKAFENR